MTKRCLNPGLLRITGVGKDRLQALRPAIGVAGDENLKRRYTMVGSVEAKTEGEEKRGGNYKEREALSMRINPLRRTAIHSLVNSEM